MITYVEWSNDTGKPFYEFCSETRDRPLALFIPLARLETETCQFLVWTPKPARSACQITQCRNVGNESRYNDNGVNEILYGESGGVEKHWSLKLIFVLFLHYSEVWSVKSQSKFACTCLPFASIKSREHIIHTLEDGLTIPIVHFLQLFHGEICWALNPYLRFIDVIW